MHIKLSIALLAALVLTGCGGESTPPPATTAQSIDAQSATSQSPVSELPASQTTAPQTTASQGEVPAQTSAEEDVPASAIPAEPDNEASETDGEVVEFVQQTDAALVGCEAGLADMKTVMLRLVNEARSVARQCGATTYAVVDEISWDDRLATAAATHSADMVEFNFFSHTGSNGLSVAERADAAGFDWGSVGENIAAGQASLAEAQDGWLESPGHCINIMGEQYTHIGAACKAGNNNDYGTYWTVVFGRPF